MLVNIIPSICLASLFMLSLLGKKFIQPLMSFFCLFFNVNIVKWPPRRSSSDSQTFIYNPSFWKHSLSSLPFCWCWGRVIWVALWARQKEEICIGMEAALCLREQWSCQSLSGCKVYFQYQLWRLEDLWATKMPCSWTEKLESTKIPDGHFQPLPPFLPYWQRHRD